MTHRCGPDLVTDDVTLAAKIKDAVYSLNTMIEAACRVGLTISLEVQTTSYSDGNEWPTVFVTVSRRL